METKKRNEALYRNSVSYFGGLVVVSSALLIAIALIMQVSSARPNPYVGIFTYLVFPAFLAAGLLLLLYGMVRESARRRRFHVEEALPFPRLDLNDPLHRKRFGYALIGGSLLMVLLAAVSYNAFLFTESVTFCGKVCHKVMQPEHTAYLYSPHARVRCVDCHVGSGASWYVKSKLSGARQVIAVLLHTYPTPIPVPIKNLRPARETCEECHWPQKFYGAQLIQNPHFRYDEKNTAEQVSLLIKTGGGSPKLGENAGIHWHMIIANKVTFYSIDAEQQQIPIVSITSEDGPAKEYQSLDFKVTEAQRASLIQDVMDCMDCHNRPTHIFGAPETAVDRALSSGILSPDLPWIKRITVDTLVKDYPDNLAAHEGIRQDISGFYAEKYPEVAKSKVALIEEAIGAATHIYDRSVFSAMKVNWKSYASNIGHRNWPGCFRCHDGRHVTQSGEVLSMDCTTCHTMPQRGRLTPIGTVLTASSENWHPWELKGRHAQILCTRCHAAGYRPPTDCGECHKMDPKAPMMGMGCESCHEKPQEVQPIADCKGCHPELPGLHAKGGHPDATCTTCHAAHRWVVTGRDTCLSCHPGKKNHNLEGGACSGCHEFKEGKAA